MARQFPAIQEPTPTIEGLLTTVQQMKNIIETLLGTAPGAEDGQVVTLGDIPVLFTTETYSPLEAFDNPALSSSGTFLQTQAVIAEARYAVAQDILLLQANVDQNTADLVQEAVTRATDDSALATDISTLTATVDDVSAGSTFKMEAGATGGGVFASVEASVYAATPDDFIGGGFSLKVVSDGGGGYQTNFEVSADTFVFVDGDVSPFYISGGITYLNGAVVKGVMTSDDGNLVIDFTNAVITVSD